jgi:hypothetical protein
MGLRVGGGEIRRAGYLEDASVAHEHRYTHQVGAKGAEVKGRNRQHKALQRPMLGAVPVTLLLH